MQKNIYFSLISVFLFWGCNAQVKEGLLSKRLIVYDKISSEDSVKIVHNTNQKSWFRNNTEIEQVGTLPSFIYDAFQENRLKNMRYVFKSLRDSSVYEYASMTDTATCLGIYKLFSDIELTTGTPVYRGALWVTSVSGERELTDTTIDDVKYKRFETETDTAGLHLINTFYLQCGYPNILSIAPRHNKIFGCPTLINEFRNVDFYTKGGSMGVLKSTIIKDKLTEEETKVFDVWEQYAKNNPFKEKKVVEQKSKKKK